MVPAVDAATLKELESALRGSILLRGGEGYDQARRVWNGMIDKRPLAIVRVAGVAGIRASVRFAQTHGLPVAIRGGGHNVAGSAVCDDGLVIDLAAMKSIRVDPLARRARAEGGVLWGEYDHETQAFGLASPGGAVSTTGIAGLTLGGGFGYLSRMYGLACDNLISADVVTASGGFVTASEDSNPDLFWALRGGGGNFGVVTSFEYQLQPVQHVLTGFVAFPFAMADAVLKRFREVALEAPDHRVWFAGALQLPHIGKVAAVVMSHFGAEEEGWQALRPIRELGSILFDTVARVPYCVMQRQLDANSPKGQRHYWKSAYLSELSDEVIGLILTAMENTAGDLDQVMIETHGGAISRTAKDATAFEHRQVRFNLGIFGICTNPALDQPAIAWARSLYQQILPHSTGGTYVNYLSEGDDVHTAYSDARFSRLARIKARYDPGNLFRFNHNIAPA
ncbi:MAG: FAD-binding oxidoreductase [Bryobacterales bacterium]|nr:FAD-binding oxidoreductase [Bryobacterales bacterium]